MPTLLSCGILVFNQRGEILLGHQTGKSYWDLPKGLIDWGEEPIDCALRETFEEFGITFAKDRLFDVGRKSYYPDKDLHLFAVQSDAQEVAISACQCTSSFVHPETGQTILEVDAFAWGAVAELKELLTPKMHGLLIQEGLLLAAKALLHHQR